MEYSKNYCSSILDSLVDDILFSSNYRTKYVVQRGAIVGYLRNIKRAVTSIRLRKYSTKV